MPSYAIIIHWSVCQDYHHNSECGIRAVHCISGFPLFIVSTEIRTLSKEIMHVENTTHPAQLQSMLFQLYNSVQSSCEIPEISPSFWGAFHMEAKFGGKDKHT